jgi:hypothetical protein
MRPDRRGRGARARSAGLAAVVALALAGAARAGDETGFLERSGKPLIEVRASCPWPSAVNKGWVPITVELSNRDEDPHAVDISARAYGYPIATEVSESIELGPRESVRLELLCPIQSANSYYQVEVSGLGHRAGLAPIAGGSAVNESQAVLAIGPRSTEASTITRWSEEISTAQIGYGGGSTANNNLSFGFALADELPASSVAYSSLDLAVIDAAEGLPPPQVLEPLLAWVRAGGSLIVVGAAATETCRGNESIASWMEPRFAHEVREGVKYHFGLGRLAVLDDAGFLESEAVRGIVRELAQADLGLVPDPGGSRSSRVQPAIPELGQIPYRVFALLLLVFAIAIGPVNFLWVARSRKPVRLLLTIPGIALATSLLLLVYGVFFQGLDVKTASASVALLDQRSHRSACVEKRMMFAGLAPSDGLRPGQGTGVHVVTDQGMSALGMGRRDRYQLDVERKPELVLGADFLPTRVPTMQVICAERAERARLEVAKDGDGYEVTNNLGVEVRELVLRDPDGNAFVLKERLPPGAAATLIADSARGTALEQRILFDQGMPPLPMSSALPQACYAATLASSPFRDACGIETNELSSDHKLIGVLPLDAETWQ